MLLLMMPMRIIAPGRRTGCWTPTSPIVIGPVVTISVTVAVTITIAVAIAVTVPIAIIWDEVHRLKENDWFIFFGINSKIFIFDKIKCGIMPRYSTLNIVTDSLCQSSHMREIRKTN